MCALRKPSTSNPADFDLIVRVLDALAGRLRLRATDVGAEAPARTATEVHRAAEAMRALAELHRLGVPERGLLASVAVRAIELELTGLDVERQVGPIPIGIGGEAIDLFTSAAACLLDNVRVHSKARAAAVSLMLGDGALALVVSDDGRGFDPEDVEHPTPGAARARLAQLQIETARRGGTLRIDAAPGRGTRVEVVLPVAVIGPPEPCSW